MNVRHLEIYAKLQPKQTGLEAERNTGESCINAEIKAGPIQSLGKKPEPNLIIERPKKEKSFFSKFFGSKIEEPEKVDEKPII